MTLISRERRQGSEQGIYWPSVKTDGNSHRVLGKVINILLALSVGLLMPHSPVSFGVSLRRDEVSRVSHGPVVPKRLVGEPRRQRHAAGPAMVLLLAERILMVAVYYGTNLTVRQLGRLFGVFSSTVCPAIQRLDRC